MPSPASCFPGFGFLGLARQLFHRRLEIFDLRLKLRERVLEILDCRAQIRLGDVVAIHPSAESQSTTTGRM